MANIYESLSKYQTNLMEKWVKQINFYRVGAKTTVAVLTLSNGFEVVGTSACVNPENFDKELGDKYSLIDALDKLDEFNGFYEQTKSTPKSNDYTFPLGDGNTHI
jgi:molybdopterin/thiamine biosynthesis adenylyltransferase